jgi:hypothetical protein
MGVALMDVSLMGVPLTGVSQAYLSWAWLLWWMIVVSNNFLNFRYLGFGPFCRSTPPYPGTGSNSAVFWLKTRKESTPTHV